MTRNDLGLCAVCGRPARERHHPTGRGADAQYFDPHWTVPLCSGCHRQDLPLWRDFGIDQLTDPVTARLARCAFFVGRLRLAGRGLDAEAVAGLHDCLVATWQASCSQTVVS
jgi:hypothetical protein